MTTKDDEGKTSDKAVFSHPPKTGSFDIASEEVLLTFLTKCANGELDPPFRGTLMEVMTAHLDKTPSPRVLKQRYGTSLSSSRPLASRRWENRPRSVL